MELMKMSNKKISIKNFIISHFVIKSICRDYGLYPFDISVEFSKETFIDSSGLKINIKESLNRKQKNLSILNMYLSSFKNLHGVDLDKSVYESGMSACSFLCDIYFYDYKLNCEDVKVTSSNFPLFFILSKNIINPYFDINCKSAIDFPVTCTCSNDFDFAIEGSDVCIGINGIKEEYRDLLIFYCLDNCDSLKCGKNKEIISSFVSSTDVMRMVYPVLESYFNNDEHKIDSFLGFLKISSDMPSGRVWVQEKTNLVKTAKYALDGNFWIYGLIEKMLAPARGSDFSIKQKWAPIANQFWLDMEKARKDAGLSGASLECMLRVKDPEIKEKPFVVQKMIEDFMRS